MQKIETERLILRGWQMSNANDLFEFGRSESVTRAGWKPLGSISESRKCIQGMMDSADSWAITRKESGKVIGWMILGDIGRYDRYKEIEFIVSEKYQNQGFATEAVRGVLKYAFETLDLLVVAVCHYPGNVQSKRVIEKCGFTYEGTLRKYSRNLSDSVRYSMLKEDWEDSK
jgi:RimJ/RimL family protein N-acetyltransferase